MNNNKNFFRYCQESSNPYHLVHPSSSFTYLLILFLSFFNFLSNFFKNIFTLKFFYCLPFWFPLGLPRFYIYSDPLEQFEIGFFHYKFTAFSNLSMPFTTIFILYFFLYFPLSNNNFLIFFWKLVELLKNLFYVNIHNSLKHQESFIIFYIVFFIILYSNWSGMVPFTYTLTSLVVTSFSASIMLFILVCLESIQRNGWFFFDHFLPSGVGTQGLRWMVVIEIISYIIRVISLAVRLFANLLSGHILLKVLIGFFIIGLNTIISAGGLSAPILIVYFLVLLLITILELFISFLQAYTFTFLTIIYFGEITRALVKVNFSIYKFILNKAFRLVLYISRRQDTIIFLFLFNFNAAVSNQIYFQEPGTGLMDEIIVFHDQVMFFLIIIVVTILCLIIVLINKFFYKKNKDINLYIKNTLKSTILLWGVYLELFWTLVPCAILLIIVFPSFAILYSSTGRLNKVSSGVSVKVIGRQWYWTYEYVDHLGNIALFDSYMLPESDLPEGSFRNLETTNRLAVPSYELVKFLITASDVIHSFAVPGFGVKLDACPGRLNEVNVAVEKSGVYFGQCSEICGVNHGFMPIAIEVYDSEVLKSISNIKSEDRLSLFNETTKIENISKEEVVCDDEPTNPVPEYHPDFKGPRRENHETIFKKEIEELKKKAEGQEPKKEGRVVSKLEWFGTFVLATYLVAYFVGKSYGVNIDDNIIDFVKDAAEAIANIFKGKGSGNNSGNGR